MRTEDATAAVEQSIDEDPNDSVHHSWQQITSPATFWRVLRQDLGLRAYKIQLGPELSSNDHQALPTFLE